MADLVDETNVKKALLDDAAIAAIRNKAAKIEAGVAGECGHCGEDMPRLIKGVCCPCRDKLKLP